MQNTNRGIAILQTKTPHPMAASSFHFTALRPKLRDELSSRSVLNRINRVTESHAFSRFRTKSKGLWLLAGIHSEPISNESKRGSVIDEIRCNPKHERAKSVENKDDE